MKTIFCRAFTVLLLAGASVAWSVHAQSVHAPETAALGLIVGFRSSPENLAGLEALQGAGRTRPVLAQAAWERQVQRGRERLKQVATEAGLPLHSVGDAGNAQLLRFERPMQGQALQDALRRARLHPDVAWVEPNVLLKRLQTTPNDPGYTQQWHLQMPAVGGTSAINMPPAWALTTGSAGITAAVLDTGILPHPDLVGRTWAGYDFVSEVDFASDGNGRDTDPTDPGDWVTRNGNNAAVQQLVDAGLCDVAPSSWHGSFIAGQIAATSNNSLGIAGINWENKVLPVRVSGKCGALLSDLLDGMRWAAGLPVDGVPPNPNPARIINLSFGGDIPCSRSALYQSAIDEVTAQGALVVVAAGNGSSPLMRPADCQRVLSVGAVRRDGLKTDYSSYGPQLGLMAPGGSVAEDVLLYSTSNSGLTSAVPAQDYYGNLQGTSFSAPLAAGVATLMLSLNPALSPAQLVDRMRSGVRPWSSVARVPRYPTCSSDSLSQSVCHCTTETCGSGLLDADRAVRLALGPAVVIAPVAAVAPGAAVALDGRESVPIPGATITRYVWQQLEGPGVSITSSNAALASVTLSSAETRYVFQLTVTDSEGRTGSDRVSVVAVAPVASGGGGSIGGFWALALWVWVLAMGWAVRRRGLTHRLV
ncbi:MAG: S8 family serine peptidase [Hydrogenophaga sp.]|uniref:S8 family serine peptidase n=1 Tax=Hydrogenophaga sp. TaxID=1904254 RepID=UPI002759FCF4|nr:S8 family serine peptidase [Hydrogenophaga sp.]MDP2418580.1 S8 family serine peptidase [Hydrogenophaga sp.]MDZ4187978.1 S8 family serine peptidase [Hydrogenophaga sp.]